jgi:transketolase
MTVQGNEVISDADLTQVGGLARQLRVDSIRASTAAGSGHPTSSLSAADLMAVLLARQLRYDWQHPDLPTNDHLIFSKGHASPLLYANVRSRRCDRRRRTGGHRRFGSRLQGHPTPVLPWVDVATGSLGQGVAYAVGVAPAGQHLDRLPFQVWTLCGDSEMPEGSVWETLDKAALYRLANLTVIVDVNRLGQRGPTELGWDLDVYRKRVEAFGCTAIELDGHDLAAIDRRSLPPATPNVRPCCRPHGQGQGGARTGRPRRLARPRAARRHRRASGRRPRRPVELRRAQPGTAACTAPAALAYR